MIKFLIRSFIPDCDNTGNTEVRKRYGILAGILGIICNLTLFVIKLCAGMMIKSIAVISDGFNNLSDMGSSFISVFSSKLSSLSPDKDHPYGHGRAEYVSSLLVAILIILFGFELLGSSVSKIIRAEEVSSSPLVIILLVFSMLVKLWMWYCNKYMGRKINSTVLLAASRDSINDVFATGAVVVSAVVSPFVSFPLDGIMGVAVSVLILVNGYYIAKDTIDKLLGQQPDEELKCKIEAAVQDNDMVIGIHDLMIHDYGPGRTIASVHAEVPGNLSLAEVHSVIDSAEKRILSELNVNIVIHMDPIEVKDI